MSDDVLGGPMCLDTVERYLGGKMEQIKIEPYDVEEAKSDIASRIYTMMCEWSDSRPVRSDPRIASIGLMLSDDRTRFVGVRFGIEFANEGIVDFEMEIKRRK